MIITISESLEARLRELAEQEGINLDSLAEILITEALDREEQDTLAETTVNQTAENA